MITEHKERPVSGCQRLERRDVRRQPRHRPVDDVAGQGDEIRRELLGHVDDALDICEPHRRPHMQIADLHDPQSVEIRWQPLHGNVDTTDVGTTERGERADADGSQRTHRHPHGAGLIEERVHSGQRRQRGGCEQQNVPRHRQHEQKAEPSHAQKAQRLHPLVTPALAVAITEPVDDGQGPVSYTHLTLPTNREV